MASENELGDWVGIEQKLTGIRHYTGNKVFGLQFLYEKGESTKIMTNPDCQLMQLSNIRDGTQVERITLSFAKQDRYLTNVTFIDCKEKECATLTMFEGNSTQSHFYLAEGQHIEKFRVAINHKGIFAI